MSEDHDMLNADAMTQDVEWDDDLAYGTTWDDDITRRMVVLSINQPLMTDALHLADKEYVHRLMTNGELARLADFVRAPLRDMLVSEFGFDDLVVAWDGRGHRALHGSRPRDARLGMARCHHGSTPLRGTFGT